MESSAVSAQQGVPTKEPTVAVSAAQPGSKTASLPRTKVSDATPTVKADDSGLAKEPATGKLPSTAPADAPSPALETGPAAVALPVAPAPVEGGVKKTGKEPRAIDSRRVAHQRNKLILWIVWMVLMVLTLLFVVLAFVTFGRVQYIQDHNSGEVASVVVGERDLWGVLTATMITPIAMIAFFVFGTYVLIYKSVTESGFTYVVGAWHASTLWLALLTLQSAVTLQAHNSQSKNRWPNVPEFKWGTDDSALYTATFSIAYVLAGLYLCLFVTMYLLKSSLKELRLEDEIGVEKPEGGKADSTGVLDASDQNKLDSIV